LQTLDWSFETPEKKPNNLTGNLIIVLSCTKTRLNLPAFLNESISSLPILHIITNDSIYFKNSVHDSLLVFFAIACLLTETAVSASIFAAKSLQLTVPCMDWQQIAYKTSAGSTKLLRIRNPVLVAIFSI
jgi:hypothetical protein